MKKILCAILCAALILSLGLCAFAAGSESVQSAALTYRGISIVVNGNALVPQDASGKAVEPFIMDGTTYLPVRAVAAALGLGVDWDGATSTVILSSGGQISYGSGSPLSSNEVKNVDITYRGIQISLDGKKISPTDANGKTVEPFILDGTTYLPVRGIANALDILVDWNGETSTVYLTTTGGGEEEPVKLWVLVRETWKNDDFSSVTTHEYDGDGYETKSTAVWDDGSKDVTEYYYDAQRNCVKTVYASSYFSYVQNCEFDANGNMTAYSYSGDMSGSTRYTYNSNGDILTEENTYDGSTVVDTYEYDSQGRYSRIVSRDKVGGGEISVRSYEYSTRGTYDIVRITETAVGQGPVVYEEIYENGDIIEYSCTSSSPAVDSYRYVYTNDSSGRTVKCVYYFEDELALTTAYTYDSNGNLVKTVDTDATGAVTGTSTYEYSLVTINR